MINIHLWILILFVEHMFTKYFKFIHFESSYDSLILVKVKYIRSRFEELITLIFIWMLERDGAHISTCSLSYFSVLSSFTFVLFLAFTFIFYLADLLIRVVFFYIGTSMRIKKNYQLLIIASNFLIYWFNAL